jgi:hypothetical protein
MTPKDSYISQVRAALWGGETEWPAEWSDVHMRMHAMQGTGALVYPSVLGLETVPPQARMQMKAVCMQTMQQQVHLQHVLQTAWQALEQAGIQAVLMKGAGLAALYPEPHMRQWGDIDLFVGVEQYHPACAAMRKAFPEALKFDEELDHYKHYNLIADGVSIEIHRVSVGWQHPVDERRYARMEAYGMTKSEELRLNGLTVRVPEPTFNALFVMLHSWEHMMTQGASVRQLCDLVLLLHKRVSEIDVPRLKAWLNALCLTDVWQLYMWIAVKRLGLPETEAPCFTDTFAERAEHLLNDLLEGRLSEPKHTAEMPKGRIARKWHTMQERLANAKRIGQYSPAYARHMRTTTLLHGAMRFFAKDRKWE